MGARRDARKKFERERERSIACRDVFVDVVVIQRCVIFREMLDANAVTYYSLYCDDFLKALLFL